MGALITIILGVVVIFIVGIIIAKRISLATLIVNYQNFRKIKRSLLKHRYSLLCNPKTAKRKTISFNRRKLIGTGRNENEYYWNLRFSKEQGVILETIQRDRTVHNRFVYSSGEKKFICTNESGLSGGNRQIIERYVNRKYT